MAKKGDWLTCQECESEFKVISDRHEQIAYCPYCGYDIEEDEEEDEDEEYE
jgi:uncharacterized paraquat-inducible protein A